MKYKTFWLAGLLGPMLVLCAPAQAVESTIVTGPTHTLFVDKGAVFAMGTNFFGEVKAETPTTDYPKIRTPVRYEGLLNVKSVAAGEARSAALHNDGTVSVWGRKAEQSATMYGITKTFPEVTGATKLVTIGQGPVTDIAYTSHSLYYIQGGVVYKHTFTAPAIALQIPDNAVAKSIAAGSSHLVVLFQDGSVGTTGSNTYGQMGQGPGTFAPDVVTKVEGVSNIVDITAGRETSFAKTSDGMVFGWGRNTAYQMGDGTINNYFYPTPIPAIQGVKKILGSGNSTIGLMDDGTVRVAGFHNYISSVSYNSAKTWKVLPEVSGMKDIASGWGSANMVSNATSGVIHGWSMNRNGELGDGTTVPEQHKLVSAVFTPYEPPVEEVAVVVAPTPVVATPEPTPAPTPEPVDTAIAMPFLEPQAPAQEAVVATPEPTVITTVVDAVVDVVTAVVDAVVEAVTAVVDTVVAIVTPVHEPVVVIAEPTPVAAAPKCNNGFGNGDQCAPGNSLMNNNAENAQGVKSNNGKSATPAPVVVAAATTKKK
jgi:alpha-tubulin suppressor-like RCC1 family protein